MSGIVIKAAHLSKSYRVAHQRESPRRYVALRDVIADGVRSFARKTNDLFAGRQIIEGGEIEEFWALRDVSFEVREGEVLGIIGRNGAGKSTLLKILSRITEPSEGRVTIRGRVASLLEIGTGFHPELTGRENIYLNGAILGMTRQEINQKFDAIVAFAGTEKFLDTPIKRYSSGMSVRLAFAVAAHLEPEILLIDEVLAVGDFDFQQKCLGRMRSVSSQDGRTILFVSHNMAAINSLCDRAILMNGGRVQHFGSATTISELYLASGASGENRCKKWTYREAPGDDRVKFARIAVVPDGGDDNMLIEMGSAFYIETDYWNLVDDASIVLELIVRANDGTPVFHSYSSESDENARRPCARGLVRSSCRIPGHLLNAGRYGIEMYLSDGRPSNEFGVVDAVSLVVHEMKERGNLTYYGQFIGYVHPKLTWRSQLIHAEVEKVN